MKENNIIVVKDLCKEFKTPKRERGVRGTIKYLFSRDYVTTCAVSSLNFSIKRGEIVAFIGPNGAGKSTTIKILTGILEKTSGDIKVNNIDPMKNRERNALSSGVVFGQRSQLWWALPFRDSLELLKIMYQIPDEVYDENLKLFERLTNIKELYDKPVRQMSLGQRTLCDILAAFLHNPEVVFLDEPTIGLDVEIKNSIHKLILALNEERNTTILLTTHDMVDVDKLCDRIIIIDRGRKVYDGKYIELRTKFRRYKMSRFLLDEKFWENKTNYSMLASKLNDLNVWLENEHNWLNIEYDETQTEITKLIELIKMNWEIHDVQITDLSTESIIRKIYSGVF